MGENEKRAAAQAVLRSLWGKNKPAMFVWLAVLAASSADAVQKAVGTFRGAGKSPDGVPEVPSLGSWLAMYRDHRKLRDRLFSSLSPESPEGVSASGASDEWRRFGSMGPDEIAEAAKGLNAQEQGALFQLMAPVEWPPSLGVLRKMLAQLDEADKGDSDDLDRVNADEMQFFLRVWVPCWMQYRTYPGKLFHRARSGRTGDDIDDLEDLLRLDKSVLADPLIAARWHGIVHGSNRGRFLRLAKAVKAEPRGSFKRKKAKALIAGMISQAAIGFGCEVTEAEIRELFDRIAKVRTGHVDTDLPVGETLAKAIQRNRVFPEFPQKRPDKKRS